MLEVLGAYLQIDLGQLTLKNGVAPQTLTDETQPPSTGSSSSGNTPIFAPRIQIPERFDIGTVVNSDIGQTSPRFSAVGTDMSDIGPSVSERSWVNLKHPFA